MLLLVSDFQINNKCKRKKMYFISKLCDKKLLQNIFKKKKFLDFGELVMFQDRRMKL